MPRLAAGRPKEIRRPRSRRAGARASVPPRALRDASVRPGASAGLETPARGGRFGPQPRSRGRYRTAIAQLTAATAIRSAAVEPRTSSRTVMVFPRQGLASSWRPLFGRVDSRLVLQDDCAGRPRSLRRRNGACAGGECRKAPRLPPKPARSVGAAGLRRTVEARWPISSGFCSRSCCRRSACSSRSASAGSSDSTSF